MTGSTRLMGKLGRVVSIGALWSVCALSPGAADPAMASADGLPRLDPTNGATGADYRLFAVGTAHSMDPAKLDTIIGYTGTMTVLQDAGTGEFSVTPMNLDTNGDGQADRVLQCSGFIGRGRFGLRCSEDDGLSELRFQV
ncbi:MAG TPA: hypothetical protein VFE84_12640, partial [Patescibacteria group bacterium]|nr:hypothetical protein [Patescibacteria group bacterium]